ncbi:MAG: 50S ribosome-binding GTPase [Acidimicrobiia bacterium]|nr:50S ribosome-binding GTPase [Acidimicrobiia bacterium]
MADLRTLLDLADLATVRSSGVVSESTTADLAAQVQRARLRMGFLGDALVIALAGGTGTGKSSIVNALVGHQVVETGVVRPTTDKATAIVPAVIHGDLGTLLESMAIDELVRVEGWSDLVLVDMPDIDSTEEAHRAIVEEVLPRVDAVAWVLDPEKYADPLLHDVFLARLVPYESQFVFVLNQSDRLGDSVGEVVADLEELLRRDGFAEPVVVSCIAVDRPDHDADVTRLAAVLDDHLDAKSTAIAKIAVDLRAAANGAWSEVRAPSDDGDDIERAALAAATFVGLGVQAYEVEVAHRRHRQVSE